jgi:hypothetical protein
MKCDFHADVICQEDRDGNGEWRVECQDGMTAATSRPSPGRRQNSGRASDRAQDRRPQGGPPRTSIEVALLPHNTWPYASRRRGGAAELYLWDRERLGHRLHLSDGFGEAGPVGSGNGGLARLLSHLSHRATA